MNAAPDDVFIDEINFPATDGYALTGTLFLPRGTKRHAVLINSATAVQRKIYRGFASYLAHRGCAVLTYDYRGIGDSRRPAMVGYNQPKSLVGFKASMSDWAALDVTAAVSWMRERYNTLPLAYVGHSFGGQALGLIANNSEISRAAFVASQAATWRLMTSPEKYRVFAFMNLIGVRWFTRSATPRAGPASARICPRASSCNGPSGSQARAISSIQNCRRWQILQSSRASYGRCASQTTPGRRGRRSNCS